MTQEEYTAAQAALANAETERAALEQLRRDLIDKARDFNDQTKACTNKITALDRSTAPLKAQVADYIGEVKRQQAEKMRAESEAKAKAAAEAQAKAAEEAAKQPSPAQLMAEIQSLKEQLAAKG